MIAIIDYGLGNVRAFANIFAAGDVPFVIAVGPQDLRKATRVILPGVGAFDQAMKRLNASGMREPLDELALQHKVPMLGVCVGMQILMERSEEGSEPGLGWIPGDVVRFRSEGSPHLRVPHMGWNDVRALRSNGLFAGLEAAAEFYFLHSYLARCRMQDHVLATTNYGAEFACAVHRENVYGVQFHPEKSHGHGIRLLKNFAEL